jgi:hypothetical protein
MTPAHVRELGNLLSRSMGQLDDAVGVARQAENLSGLISGATGVIRGVGATNNG